MSHDRNGHLSELALDRLRYDPPESDATFFAQARDHLDDCAACRAALAALEASDAVNTLAPPRAVSPRKKAWLTGFAIVAMAALAFFVIRSDTLVVPPAPDRLTPRGAPFELGVYAHDGASAREVGDGAVVHPGERIGFRVRTSRDGHLIVVGWDDTRRMYVAHAATPLAKSDLATTLDAAVRLDERLGEEHLLAVFCKTPIDLAALSADPTFAPNAADRVRLEARDCTLRERVLDKRPAP